jgi:hypothetical protein
MSGGTGYRAWYGAHTSVTVRLPHPKPFVARIFFQEDDIGMWREEGRRWRLSRTTRRDWNVEAMRRKEGALFIVHRRQARW